jgi:hypothetical protein
MYRRLARRGGGLLFAVASGLNVAPGPSARHLASAPFLYVVIPTEAAFGPDGAAQVDGKSSLGQRPRSGRKISDLLFPSFLAGGQPFRAMRFAFRVPHSSYGEECGF